MDAPPPAPVDPPVVCKFLRTKHAYGTYQGEIRPWQEGRSTTAVYWCLCTMEPWGPDDGYSHAQRCRPGRSCFAEKTG